MRSAPFGPCGGGSGTLSQTVRRYWSCLTGLSPAGLGYCRYWSTHMRPRSSKLMLTGWRIMRLGGDGRDGEAVGHRHPPRGLGRREALCRCDTGKEQEAEGGPGGEVAGHGSAPDDGDTMKDEGTRREKQGAGRAVGRRKISREAAAASRRRPAFP